MLKWLLDVLFPIFPDPTPMKGGLSPIVFDAAMRVHRLGRLYPWNRFEHEIFLHELLAACEIARMQKRSQKVTGAVAQEAKA